MTSSSAIGGHSPGFAATQRNDRWWVEPLWTGVGFLLFVIYSTWSGLQGEHYYHHGYLSPFYSPVLFTDPTVPGAAPVEHSWFGIVPEWLKSLFPSFMSYSPAILILAGPLTFRATCYYYRKFYYRAYFFTPPGCAVNAAPRKNYRGETFLFLFQNLHRYALYAAIALVFILSYDAYLAWVHGPPGLRLGKIILTINPILIAAYTFGCHSFRHLIGGNLNCFSCDRVTTTRHGIWGFASKSLNAHHMRWAWASLIWVAFSDLYVRLVSMGHIRDLSLLG